MRLSGSTVLITGGATGIGRSLARCSRDHGSTVIVCGRREDRLAQAAEALPGIATTRKRNAARSLPMMSADDFVNQACDQLERDVEEIRVATPARR